MSLLWPAYLAGLVALGLPWLLHRFSRTDPPERPFPSKRFLQAAEPPVSRERRLRYRWLFALRVLLLIGLCLLFAEPWLRDDPTAAGVDRQHLIVIDTSLSQRHGERWSRTLAAARKAIDAVPAGHSVQLLAADTTLSNLTDLSADPGAARAALSSLQPGHGAVDYGELMQRLDIVAARSELPVVATLITDAQRRSLPQRLAALTARDVEKLTIIDVAQAGERNDYLSATARTTDGVHARIAVTVGSSIVEGAAATGENKTVESIRQLVVTHEGQVLATENVVLGAGETRTLLIDRVTMPAAEVVSLNIAFENDDALPDDDSVNVVVRAATPASVGIRAIDTPLPRQAPVFIATALETDAVARIIEAPATQGLSDELRHAIVFADLDASGQVPPAVEQFVESGGNVLLVDVGATRQAITFDGPAGIALIDEAHPMAIGSLDWYEPAWYGAPEWARATEADSTVTEIDSRADSPDVQVLLQTTNGTPVLVERRLSSAEASGASASVVSARGSGADSADEIRLDGAGRLLIIADPLDGELSDFPLQPAFVGFMQHLVEYFEASNAIPERLAAGSRLDLPANAQVVDDAGEQLLELGSAAGGRSLRLDTPGLYEVISQQGSHWLEVIVADRESDIATLPATELQAWEARHAVAARSTASTDDAVEASANGATLASDAALREQGALALWHWLLPLALALVTGESLLANRRLDIRRDGS